MHSWQIDKTEVEPGPSDPRAVADQDLVGLRAEAAVQEAVVHRVARAVLQVDVQVDPGQQAVASRTALPIAHVLTETQRTVRAGTAATPDHARTSVATSGRVPHPLLALRIVVMSAVIVQGLLLRVRVMPIPAHLVTIDVTTDRVRRVMMRVVMIVGVRAQTVQVRIVPVQRLLVRRIVVMSGHDHLLLAPATRIPARRVMMRVVMIVGVRALLVRRIVVMSAVIVQGLLHRVPVIRIPARRVMMRVVMIVGVRAQTVREVLVKAAVVRRVVMSETAVDRTLQSIGVTRVTRFVIRESLTTSLLKILTVVCSLNCAACLKACRFWLPVTWWQPSAPWRTTTWIWRLSM